MVRAHIVASSFIILAVVLALIALILIATVSPDRSALHITVKITNLVSAMAVETGFVIIIGVAVTIKL